MNQVPLLANEYVVVYESPDPKRIYAYSPGLCRLPSGRLVATMDRGGPGVADIPGIRRDGGLWRGMIFTSDDRGRTWTHRSDMPMMHARPFVAGDGVYVLGHASDLRIMRSDDHGETWSEPTFLTQGQRWHQAPCNVHYANGKVYLVMERNTDPTFRGWAVSKLAPVLMSAGLGDDLTRRESWTFATELSFDDAVNAAGRPNLIGAPFYETGPTAPDNPADRRVMNPIGWLETNVVQFNDPSHVWHDPSGRTFHLWMRAHTGATNLACIAKVVEAADGSMTTMLETAPSGEAVLYVPCPGGQMKFHILYDEPTRLFWLLSSQSTDSMIRPALLPPNRFNLPNNERHRLALHFSKNCIDWCFAGMVAMGGDAKQSRHYASMVADGEDLHVLSRSGDARARNAHDGNLITFHTVRRFRQLAY
ncbi:MAG: sialidase family protein [Armatimonadota bacterium]